MSYIKNNLNTGEKLKYHSRISIKPLIINYIFVFFFALALFFYCYFLFDVFTGVIVSIVFFILYLPIVLIVYFGSEFGVSGKRVISKKGIISRNASEMNLSSIESVNVDQGIVGRMLNYGSLKISGRGTTTVDFNGIDDPIKVRKLIQNKN